MITFRTLGKLGRFGNQLFQYAGTRLYADLHEYSWAFPDWVGTSIFQQVRPYTTLEHLKTRLMPTIQLSDMKSVSAIHRLQSMVHLWHQQKLSELYAHPSDNIDLYGYLQDAYSLELLTEHKQKILPWFRWQPYVEQAFREATKQTSSWVGIHIRRGDFIKRGLAVPIERYQEAIRNIPVQTPVYISTDDTTLIPQLTGVNLLLLQNPLPDIPDFIFDFWMLAQASTIYGCGSTFSWWAAYLGNKDSYFSPPLTHLWPQNYSPALIKQSI